jgi:hypothetical protein
MIPTRGEGIDRLLFFVMRKKHVQRTHYGMALRATSATLSLSAGQYLHVCILEGTMAGRCTFLPPSMTPLSSTPYRHNIRRIVTIVTIVGRNDAKVNPFIPDLCHCSIMLSFCDIVRGYYSFPISVFCFNNDPGEQAK